jgi:hypothetical protein
LRTLPGEQDSSDDGSGDSDGERIRTARSGSVRGEDDREKGDEEGTSGEVVVRRGKAAGERSAGHEEEGGEGCCVSIRDKGEE